ncbi:MAG: histidine--tRNA ligase [Desulfobacterales bacterium]|nr:histidine--tRNA ligase [Desulfobacterales bacterium]
MIQLIKGFKDVLPGEIEVWQTIERVAKETFEDFGFTEIRLPIVEKAELFARSIGDTTDIVEKEMYTFEDGKRGNVTLRPEATASVVRSYIQHKMYASDPIRKFYTIGPMFRRERPQKGRYRQFYQIDAEVFGIDSPYLDAQLIFMLATLLSKLDAKDVKAHINSLGCPCCRPNFQKALKELLDAKKEHLCENCLRRAEKNPLRVLDCKVPACREAVEGAPSILDHLCGECQDHFETVKRVLTENGVEYEVDKRLVRGLDYYTRTAFEVLTTSLGAQNAVAGGGRYDGLVKALGGPEVPAIGFAIGFDRLAEIVAMQQEITADGPTLYISPLGEKATEQAAHWTMQLAAAGVACETDFGGRSLKSHMKRADKLKASHVLMIGDNELETGKAALRNMTTKEQVEIELANLVKTLKDKLG